MGVGECDDPVMWPSQRLHTQKVLALWLFFHFVLLIPLPDCEVRIAHTQHAGRSYFNIYKMRGSSKRGFIIQECRLWSLHVRCDSDFFFHTTEKPTTLNKIQNARVLRRTMLSVCQRGVLHNGDLLRASGYIVIARWKYFNLLHIVRAARWRWSFCWLLLSSSANFSLNLIHVHE